MPMPVRQCALSRPDPELPRRPDVWQTYDITLIGREVTVVLNGTTVIHDQEIPGGALDSHEAMPGPIYLQGSEKGHVAFRNIVVTPRTLIGPSGERRSARVATLLKLVRSKQFEFYRNRWNFKLFGEP